MTRRSTFVAAASVWLLVGGASCEPSPWALQLVDACDPDGTDLLLAQGDRLELQLNRQSDGALVGTETWSRSDGEAEFSIPSGEQDELLIAKAWLFTQAELLGFGTTIFDLRLGGGVVGVALNPPGELRRTGIGSCTDMRAPRTEHTATSDGQGKVWLVGGYGPELNSTGGRQNLMWETFETFSTSSETFANESTTSVRRGHGAALLDGVLYAHGGIGTDEDADGNLRAAMNDSTLRIDTQTGQTELLETLSNQSRAYHTANVAADSLVWIGGYPGLNATNAIDSVERYAEGQNGTDDIGNLITSRARHETLTLNERVLLVLGGQDAVPIAETEFLVLSGNGSNASAVAGPSLGEARSGTASAIHERIVFVAGGDPAGLTSEPYDARGSDFIDVIHLDGDREGGVSLVCEDQEGVPLVLSTPQVGAGTWWTGVGFAVAGGFNANGTAQSDIELFVPVDVSRSDCVFQVSLLEGANGLDGTRGLANRRAFFTSTPLSTGAVLITGGVAGDVSDPRAVAASEIFAVADPGLPE